MQCIITEKQSNHTCTFCMMKQRKENFFERLLYFAVSILTFYSPDLTCHQLLLSTYVLR